MRHWKENDFLTLSHYKMAAQSYSWAGSKEGAEMPHPLVGSILVSNLIHLFCVCGHPYFIGKVWLRCSHIGRSREERATLSQTSSQGLKDATDGKWETLSSNLHLQKKLRWGLCPPKVTRDGRGATQTGTLLLWLPGAPAVTTTPDGLSFTVGVTLHSFQAYYSFF